MDSTSAERAARAERAERDLAFIRQVVTRAQLQIDAHAFHFVHWGIIVLVWYPLSNWLQDAGRLSEMLWVGLAAGLLGFGLSIGRELSQRHRSRVPGEDTYIARQVCWITMGCIGGAGLLSGIAPAFGFIDGPDVPIIWGLAYAQLAFMTGVVYKRDFLVAGIVIFGGSLIAIAFQPAAGYILGPFMGLGMIIPGVRAERRIRLLAVGEIDGDS